MCWQLPRMEAMDQQYLFSVEKLFKFSIKWNDAVQFCIRLHSWESFTFDFISLDTAKTVWPSPVSLKLPSSEVKISRLWNCFFLCVCTALCLWDIPGIPYRTCRICLMFSLVSGYIKVCSQLFNDTTVKTLLVPIYLSDISDGPDSKTGTAVRVCSPQRLLLFDVMRKLGLVHRVLIFQKMEEMSDCVTELHGKKILAFSPLLSNLE